MAAFEEKAVEGKLKDENEEDENVKKAVKEKLNEENGEDENAKKTVKDEDGEELVEDEDEEEEEFSDVKTLYALRNRTWQTLANCSRDITRKSKAVIGILQQSFHNYINGKLEDSEIEIKFCGEQLEAIQMGELSFLFQLYEGMTLRHVRAMHWPIIPGIEEFIEAVAFYKMLTTRSILSYDDVNDIFTFVKDPNVTDEDGRFDAYVEVEGDQPLRFGRLLFTMENYIGGISDFTGELMKVCVRVSTDLEKEFFLVSLVLCQELHAGFARLEHSAKVAGKLDAMKTNILKLETYAARMAINPGASSEDLGDQFGALKLEDNLS